MNDQDEMFERATETPAFLGCPQHMPTHLPGGFDGVEPGDQGGEGVPPSRIEELKKRGEKLKASNDRSYAKMVRIAELANECVLKTTHSEYAPGQYGQDYRTFGKVMCEIRELVGPGLAERFAALPPREKPVAPSAPEMKDKAAAYRRAHYSFGDGLFPIQRLNGVECVIERCVINGREFKLTIQDSSMGDQHFSKAKLRDNGEVVCYFFTKRGKAISEKMAHGALKAYVHNLSGGGRDYHSRGGFLKQQIARAKKQ